MTKLNVTLRMLPRVFKMYDDGSPHILEVKADSKTGEVKVFMDGVPQEFENAKVSVK